MKTTRIITKSNKKPEKKDKIYGVYIDSLLTKKVVLLITEIGKNIKDVLQRKIAMTMEGKCIEEGFIRPGSINIISYSSGDIDREYITFQTVFSCKICHPVEGMLIECIAKTITKAGIHAEVIDNDTIPVTVFVARDHHTMDKNFQHIKENAKIVVKVIGSRYELNDPYICVIGKLVKNDGENIEMIPKKKPIKIGGDLYNNSEYIGGGDDPEDAGDSDDDSTEGGNEYDG